MTHLNIEDINTTIKVLNDQIDLLVDLMGSSLEDGDIATAKNCYEDVRCIRKTILSIESTHP